MDRLTSIPQSTIHRLPLYLRCLLQAQAVGMPLINSIRIAEMSGTNAAQVRKDLSYLGELGIRGTGYDVEDLITYMSRVLGIHERRRAAIVGFGKLGGALFGYSGFGERGFEIVAVFDVDPAKIGTVAGEVVVRSMDDIETVLAEQEVEIAIIATPPAQAGDAAARVVAGGVKAILNLAPVNLDVPEGVIVRQVCLSTDLQILSFYLAQGGSEKR
jgi:redox-sensing transcriptional repressor